MSVKIEDWQDIKELALMSIGTNKGTWWAAPDFGSELWILRQQGKVSGETAGTLCRMILEALQWLKTDGLVSDITCAAERANKNQISYCITLTKLDGKTTQIQEVWNGI